MALAVVSQAQELNSTSGPMPPTAAAVVDANATSATEPPVNFAPKGPQFSGISRWIHYQPFL
jgi:hypothetical protein